MTRLEAASALSVGVSAAPASSLPRLSAICAVIHGMQVAQNNADHYPFSPFPEALKQTCCTSAFR